MGSGAPGDLVDAGRAGWPGDRAGALGGPAGPGAQIAQPVSGRGGRRAAVAAGVGAIWRPGCRGLGLCPGGVPEPARAVWTLPRLKAEVGRRAGLTMWPSRLQHPAAAGDFGWRRPRRPERPPRRAAVGRSGLRLRLLRQQARAGDIRLLFGDESEALAHPCFAHAGPMALTFPSRRGGGRAGAPCWGRSALPPAT